MDLNKDVHIPLPWLVVAVVSIGSCVAGIVAWGTRLEGRQDYAVSRIVHLEEEQKIMYEVRDSVIRIETLLEEKNDGRH